MSYRKKHVKSKILGIKEKKPILLRAWFWLIFLFFFIALTILYFLFLYSGLQVKRVLISGNSKIKTEDLRKLALERSSIRLISFAGLSISTNSIFFVDKNTIKNDATKNYPEIEKISVNREFPQTLTVSVVERTPVAVFCPNQEKELCFLIDKKGIIFGQGATTEKDKIIVRQTLDKEEIFNGSKITNENVMTAISKIQAILKNNFQINLREIIISSPSKTIAYTDKNWKIYFDPNSDSTIDLQISKLNLLLKGGIPQDSFKNLKYIDLRLKDRAIVCDNLECGKE